MPVAHLAGVVPAENRIAGVVGAYAAVVGGRRSPPAGNQARTTNDRAVLSHWYLLCRRDLPEIHSAKRPFSGFGRKDRRPVVVTRFYERAAFVMSALAQAGNQGAAGLGPAVLAAVAAALDGAITGLVLTFHRISFLVADQLPGKGYAKLMGFGIRLRG